MFALLASQPRFNDIVKPFISLAPVVSTRHVGDSLAPFCVKYVLVNAVIKAVQM